jgi:hypothetical protein
MKRNIAFVFLAVLASMALISAAVGYPAQQEEKKACCEHKCMEMMKDAKIEVANTGNGVTITITSDKPELVKAIHEHFADFNMEKCKTGCCCMTKCSDECKKAHAEATCTGHEPEKCAQMKCAKSETANK